MLTAPTFQKFTGSDSLESWAYKEYQAYYNPSSGEESLELAGTLQCFCDETTDSFTYTSNGGDDSNETVELCYEYIYDTWFALIMSNAVSYLIVGINYGLRVAIIIIIVILGLDTESEQTKVITNGVFITIFFNTGLLLTSVQANLAEQASWLGVIFSGSMPDFCSDWFTDVGDTLISAMMFNVYWPMLEFFTFWGMRVGFRLLDRSFSRNEYKTKTTTIQQYLELFSGPIFFIHYKYSTILNITFVTMMYGVGLPLLFPIAAISVFALYCTEKLMLAYSYRQPPAYDDRLNNNVLAVMTYGPLLLLSVGYWMLSSKQLLYNELYTMSNSDDVYLTGHVWTEVFSGSAYGANPAMPLLVLFWVFLIGTIFRDIIYKYVTHWFPVLLIGDLEIDEDLDNYFHCVDDHDREWSIKEEENCREVLNVRILDDHTFGRFKSTKAEGATIKGVHCYDILANPLYLDDFQYFSPAMPNRADYIIDDDDEEGNDNAQSDLVRLILNLAYMTEEKALAFTFNKDTYKQQLASKKAIN